MLQIQDAKLSAGLICVMDGEQGWVLVKLVMKTEFCTGRGIYLLSEQVLLFQITLNKLNMLILF
jgi:hypothetical protein